MAAAVVAVILISVLAAPTVARTTLAEAQARATGAGAPALADPGGDSAVIMADGMNGTATTTETPAGTGNASAATPTPTATSGQGSSSASGHQFVPYESSASTVPGRIEAENYDRGLCQQGTSGQGGSGTGTVTPTTTVTTTTTTSGQGSSGQGSGNATGGMNVTIVSPTATSAVSGPNVTVTAQVTNFSIVDRQGETNAAGEGHLHFYMDVSPIPTTAGEPAIPNNTSAAWAHVSGTNYTFSNVTAGSHTFTVQLVNNDHTPVTPIVMQSVTVQVGGAGNTSSNATGTTATTTSGTGAVGAIVMAASGYDQTPTRTATTSATTTSGQGGSGMTTATTRATTSTTTSSGQGSSGQGSSGQSSSGQPGAEPGQYTCAQGWSYFDRSPGNQGGAYRQDDVDIESGGSGYVVAYVKSSEWLTYSVNVAEAGTYTATFRAASPWNDREVWVWVDGVLKAQVKVPNTGSFDAYQDATATMALPAGNHYIRLQFYRDAQNLDYFTVERTGTGGGGANVTPSPTSTGTATPTATSGQGGAGQGNATATVTPTPTTTGTVTTTPTSGTGGGNVTVPTATVTPTATATGNVTPTGTVTGNATPTATPTFGGGSGGSGTGNVTPTPTANVTDLTNQNSPQAATLVGNQSTTRLQTPALPIGLTRIAGNFTSPLFVASPDDGTGRHFVVDQTGYVRIVYLNGTVVDQPFLDVRGEMVNLLPGYDERGLLSIAFHPNFSTNGKVYAYYSAPLRDEAPDGWNCTNRLSEFTLSNASPDRVDNTTERVLLEVDKPQMNHNGGILHFGPNDGYLYLTLGDGGRADDTGLGHTPGIGNAQDLSKLLGKIARIDVDTVTGPQWNATGNTTWVSGAGTLYGIPADNPFLGNSSIPPEIYAYGFRNPAFASFDSGGSQRMFVAMAGQNLFESVLVIYRGGAYPWNIREGTHCFDPANNRTVANTTCRITSYNGQPLIGPIVELGHDIGNTVVGGVVYRGSNLTGLEGAYLFGTWSNSFATGNGTLLVATPPVGLDTATLPDDAANLTPTQNAMWTTSEMSVANNANGRINAFVRGVYETVDHEALVLINQNPGPGVNPQNSGEVWMMVPANTTGLVATGNASAAPTPTSTATATPTATPTTTTTTSAATTTATVTTAATTTAATTTAATTAGPVTIPLTAQNLAFSTSSMTAPAGAQVTITFTNQDSGVPHNFAVYTDSSAATTIFKGELVTGPATTTYTFTAPSTPGTYFFRCDVHPTTMTGSFVVT